MSERAVLFLCTGNSCRSVMAEAWWRQLAPGWTAYSAGSAPSGKVNPLAIEAMAEVGIDVSGVASESVDKYAQLPIELAVTVCDHAAETCPVFPMAQQTLHWPFDDPPAAPGDYAAKLAVCRRVRDEIKAKIEGYLAELD